MQHKRFSQFPLPVLIIGLGIGLLSGLAAAQTQTNVSFSAYFPTDPQVYGHRLIQCTFGGSGQYTSEIIGTVTVPFLSGTLTGVNITGSDDGMIASAVANDGATVYLYISADETSGARSYVASDCNLSSPAPAFACSGLYDGMVKNQTSCFLVPPDLSDCTEIQINSKRLVDVQDVRVAEGYYQDAVIFWILDTAKPFVNLNFFGLDQTLGIEYPDAASAQGYSITGFEIYGIGAALIGKGNVDAGSGQLTELWELVSVTHDPLTTDLPVVNTFSQMAIGGGYQSMLTLSNKTNHGWQGTVSLRQGNGQDWSSSWSLDGVDQSGQSSFEVNLPPRATKKFSLQSDGPIQAGYLVVQARTGYPDAINGSLYYYFSVDGQLIDSLGVPAGKPGSRFWFPVEKTATANTGFAYAAVGTSDPFPVKLTLFGSDGAKVQESTVSYMGHTSRFFAGPDGLFPGIPDGFVGAILVESPQDISLTVVRQDNIATGIQLTVLSPTGEGIRACEE